VSRALHFRKCSESNYDDFHDEHPTHDNRPVPNDGTIDSCQANEPFGVNMRIVGYETEGKRCRVGGSSILGGTVARRGPCHRRGRGAGRSFRLVRQTLVAGGQGGRSFGLAGQTTSRPRATFERGTEAATDRHSLGRTDSRRLSHRPLDLRPGRCRDSEVLPGVVSSRPRVEDPAAVGLELPEARASRPRARRRGDPPLAETRLAANQKGARQRGSPVVFVDESGFMLQPLRRRTWAPEGCTPVHRAWDRHDRLSVIGLLAISPHGRRLSLHFQVLTENVTAEHLSALLVQLHRYHRRHVVLAWDRLGAHRRAAACFEAQHPHWFTFEWLPAYAPELNPVERCWGHAKSAQLANFLPVDREHLHDAVRDSLRRQRRNQRLLRSFFAYAKLTI